MTARGRIFCIVLLTLAATIGTSLVSKRSSNPPEPGSAAPWSIRQGEKLQSWIETEYESQNLYSQTPIPLAFSRAFSERFTRASGKVEINFETGSIQVSVNGLDPNPDGSTYQLWFVEDVPGPDNTAAIELGTNGDHIMNLGTLPESGTLTAIIDPTQLENFEVNMAAVMRVSPGRKPEFVIGGMQSIRYLIGREAKLEKARTNHISFDSLFGVTPAFAQNGNSKKPVSLVAQGKDLFTNGTFGGNGRTCASCHRLELETTIDPTFISTLPPTDPLFVGEGNLALPEFSDVDPLLPAFESPFRMRSKGLILENIDGTDRDSSGKLLRPPVFRVTPAIFNLSFTEPYGDSACCADLQIFSAGAVFQHFTKSLNRVAGVDFQTPTTAQLQALEAFQLSLSSPLNGNFKVSGRGSVLSTKSDALATDTNRPEIRGRNFFLATNSCVACHQSTVFDGTNRVTGATLNLDTGVEAFGQNRGRTPTLDNGDDTGKFQIPQLFGLRKTHFFHNGAAGNNTTALPGKSLLFTNLRSAVEFYTSQEFRQSPTGLEINGTRFQALFDMTPAQIDDVTAFLEAISKP